MGFKVAFAGIFPIIGEDNQRGEVAGKIPQARHGNLPWPGMAGKVFDEMRQQAHLLVGLVKGITGRVSPAGEHFSGADARNAIPLLPGPIRVSLAGKDDAGGQVIRERRGPALP